MNEEKRPLAEETGRRTGTPRRSSRSSAVVYLLVLAAVAFLLLLFAYLMQKRNSDEIMGNLKDLRESMGSIGTIDQLLSENRALREDLNELKDQLSQVQDELKENQADLRESQAELENLRRRAGELEAENAELLRQLEPPEPEPAEDGGEAT